MFLRVLSGFGVLVGAGCALRSVAVSFATCAYVCVCKDTCKDFGTISHLRCTYTCKDVGTISIYVVQIRVHISSSSSSSLIFHRFISFDQVTVEFLLLSFHGGISSSIVAKKEDNSKVECKERRYSRPVGSAVGGVCRYGLLYQGTRHWFIYYVHVYILRVKTFVVYILSTLHKYLRAYTFISSISSSILIFHRSISFDLATVAFLLLSFHGGISSSIVAKKEDN